MRHFGNAAWINRPIIVFMESGLPLSALLSQAYVAFTIECDNEFEHQVPHRTTEYGSTPGFGKPPWLVSMAMWLRFMRHVPLEGISFSTMQSHLAISTKGLNTWLTRLGKWWGYLEIVEPNPGSLSKRISQGAIIRPTPGGKKAMEVWRTLIPVVEKRWRERFGNATVHLLENTLSNLAGQLDASVPAHFPVLEYEDQKSAAARRQLAARELALPELLTRVLLAFALEFDSVSVASLSACANVLRVTPDLGIPVRDLPRLTSLSRDGSRDALRQLLQARLGALATDPSVVRRKLLKLSSPARLARDSYISLADRIETNWSQRFGKDVVNQLRTSLEEIVLSRGGTPSPLLRGLTPYAEGWRAQLPLLQGLPHFPMVSHRGGFPDGS